VENGPGIVFEGQKTRGVDGSPGGNIGQTFTHRGVPVVNGPGVVFKGQKTRGASVPPVCGSIGQTFTHRGVPVVNGPGKHREDLLLDWVADQGR
jgi:hypothetical protein